MLVDLSGSFSGLLRVFGDFGPRNLKVFTAATVLFSQVIRGLLQMSQPGSDHTSGRALLCHVHVSLLVGYAIPVMTGLSKQERSCRRPQTGVMVCSFQL